MNNTRMSYSLDPDQTQCFILPDLGSICLQRLSADDSRRRKKLSFLLRNKSNLLQMTFDPSVSIEVTVI